MWRVYRAWVGNHVVRRRISHDPVEHDMIVSVLWQAAKEYCLIECRLSRILSWDDYREFLNMPVLPERVHNMDNQDEHDRTGDGGDPSVVH